MIQRRGEVKNKTRLYIGPPGSRDMAFKRAELPHEV
jgi:hypothetical protein